MNKTLHDVKRTMAKVRGLFPSKLPVGAKEFDQFAVSIFDIYKLPDLPSYKSAIATMILHLGPTSFYKSKHYFAVSVKKSMANQVAYETVKRIREEEKALEEKRELSASPNESVQK